MNICTDMNTSLVLEKDRVQFGNVTVSPMTGTIQWMLGVEVHATMNMPIGNRMAATQAEYKRASCFLCV